MAERSWTWRRLPWGLLGMAALLVVVEGAISRRGLEFLTMDDWAFRRSGQAAVREAVGADVLCFGDSLVKFGVLPKVLTTRTGRRAYNLAVPGGQAPGSYALLRRAIAAGARPSAVIIDFFPTLLGNGPGLNTYHWPNLLNLRETAALAWTTGEPGLFAAVGLRRVLPSLHARDGVRAQLMAALGGGTDHRLWLNALGLRNWNINDGAHVAAAPTAAEAATAFSPDRVDAYQARFLPDLRCDPANAEYIGRFLALAAQHRIRVYWILPPLLPGLQDRSEHLGIDAADRALVRDWQRRTPGLTVLDARRAAPDVGAFLDPMHLAAPGSYPFSLALADWLRHDLAEPSSATPPARWITLPPIHPQAAPATVEDLDASRLALQGRNAATR